MNVLQYTRNERNPCLRQNRPDRSYRDTLLNLPMTCTLLNMIFSKAENKILIMIRVIIRTIENINYFLSLVMEEYERLSDRNG